jgi:hypothetical protein
VFALRQLSSLGSMPAHSYEKLLEAMRTNYTLLRIEVPTLTVAFPLTTPPSPSMAELLARNMNFRWNVVRETITDVTIALAALRLPACKCEVCSRASDAHCRRCFVHH